MPQLDLTTYPSQLFWLAIFFVSLYIFIQKYVTPAINSLTTIRRMKIEEDMQQALVATENTRKLQQQYDDSRQRSLSKIAEMLDGELSNLHNLTKQKHDAAIIEINNQTQQAEQEIAIQRANYMQELDAAVIDYSSFLIKKIANLNVNNNELIKYRKI